MVFLPRCFTVPLPLGCLSRWFPLAALLWGSLLRVSVGLRSLVAPSLYLRLELIVRFALLGWWGVWVRPRWAVLSLPLCALCLAVCLLPCDPSSAAGWIVLAWCLRGLWVVPSPSRGGVSLLSLCFCSSLSLSGPSSCFACLFVCFWLLPLVCGFFLSPCGCPWWRPGPVALLVPPSRSSRYLGCSRDGLVA